MSGLLGRRTNASSDPAIGSLKIQTSVYGAVIPAVYGRTKISGNLGWFNGFKSSPVTTEQSGKGGGGATISGYSYSASVIMFLGEGPITNVRTVWQGKTKIAGDAMPTVLAAITEEHVIPSDGMISLSIVNDDFAGLVFVLILGSAERGETSLPLNSEGAQAITSLIPGTTQHVAVPTAFAGQTARISFSKKTTGDPISALAAAGLVLRAGTINQSPIPQVSSSYPAEALAYSGIAYVYGQDYPLGQTASVENHQFEVDGALQGSGVAGVPDVDPAALIVDILTNPRNGIEFERALIDSASLTQYSNYCVAHGLLMSPAYTSQRAARDAIAEILDATNSLACWVGDVLKIIPRGDAALTANGRTYTPNNAVVFDIGPDDFEPGRGGGVQITRKLAADKFNTITAEWSNRDNNYTLETVTWTDDAARDRDGVNAESSLAWGFYCNASAALQAVTLRGQRAQAALATYEFSLWWRYIAIEPGDLLRLSDPVSGLSGVIVRVLSINEDSGDSLRIVAEDCPIGNASAPVFPPQLGSGFSPLQNSNPGNATTPAFIEPPGGLTSTGLEVWAAVSGSSPLWGGCEIYTSLDGATYRHAGTIDRGARYGTLAAALAAGGSSVPVQLLGQGGQLIGVPAAAANTQQSLCFVGSPATGEFMSFEGATLTGPNAYTLGTLHRAQNGTAAGAHTPGEAFTFIDSGLGKSGALDRSLVGKTIYFKFASFNVFGGGQQSLGAVTPYAYTITGRFMDQLGQPVTAANIGVGIAGNLVSNSDFRTNSSGWTDVSWLTPDPHTNAVESYAPNMLPSAPRNFLLAQAGTNATQGQGQQSPMFSVSAGQRYGFAADTLRLNSTASVFIRWFDSAGATVSDSPVATGGPQPTITPSSLATYGRLGGFGVAPAGATQAALLVLKTLTTGAGSGVWFARPTVSLAGPNQTDYPQWDAGGVTGALASFNTVGTQQAAPGMATGMNELKSSATGTITGSVFLNSQTDIHSITISNPDAEAYTVNVFAAVEVSATGIANLPVVGMVLLASGESALPANEPADWFSVPISANPTRGTLSVSRKFTIGASASETYRIAIVIETQANATWKAPKIKTEVIKR